MKEFYNFDSMYVDGIFISDKNGMPRSTDGRSVSVSSIGPFPLELDFNTVSISSTKNPELSGNLIKALKAGRTVIKEAFGMDVSNAKEADVTLKNMRNVLL